MMMMAIILAIASHGHFFSDTTMTASRPFLWKQSTSFNAWEMYLNGTPGKDASPYACAARAEDLSGLPPAYVCVGAEDLFRDEDIDYARRLIAAGVPCELSVYPGLFHGADGFMPQAKISQRLERGYQAALAQALGL